MKFGDIAENTKNSVDRDNNPFQRYVEGGHIDSEDLQLKRYGVFGEGFVGPAFHRIFRKNQILYGSRRTYLKKVCLPNFDGITANTTFVISPKNHEKLYQPFLPYLMLSEEFTRYSIERSKGSTNPYVNWKDIASIPVQLPSLEYQKKIVRNLEKVVFVRSKLQSSLNSATKLYNVLSESIFNRDTSKSAPFSNYIESITSGKSLAASNEPAKDYEFGVLKVSCIRDGEFNPSENKMVDRSSAHMLRNNPKQGDILFSRANTPELVGDVCIVEQDFKNLFLPDKLWKITPQNDELKLFIFHQLRKLKSDGILTEIASGSSRSMQNISQKKLLGVKVAKKIDLDEVENLHRVYLIQKNIHNQLRENKKLWIKLLDHMLRESKCLMNKPSQKMASLTA